MKQVYKARLKIAEIFNKHINDSDVSEAVDFDIDGSAICISFQKSSYPRSITATVTINDMVYVFSYYGNPSKAFDDSLLNCNNSYPTKYDD